MDNTHRRARLLIGLSALGGVAFIGLYVVFVRMPIGQRWDDRALLGDQLADLAARQMLTAALHGIRISTVALMVALILAIGLIRRSVGAAALIAAAFAGAIFSAEVLKRVLPRRDLAPELNAYVDNGNIDTYPSGHSTIAMAFALALIIVSAPRYRPAVATFSMLWAAMIPMMALAAGWHRPSDVLGGMALALLWLGVAGVITVKRCGRIDPMYEGSQRLPISVTLVAGVCAAALLAWIWMGDPSNVPVGGGYVAFVVAEVAVSACALALVASYASALRGIDVTR